MIFRKRVATAKRLLHGHNYGVILRTGLLTGPLYAAEVNIYSKKEVASMKTALYQAERSG